VRQSKSRWLPILTLLQSLPPSLLTSLRSCFKRCLVSTPSFPAWGEGEEEEEEEEGEEEEEREER